MEFVRSQKGNRKIIKDGYIYVFKKELANYVRSFECQLRRAGQCRVSIKVNPNDEVIEQLHEHTHPPSNVKCEVQRVKSSIKERAESTNDSTQQIMVGELQGISEAAAVNLPNVEHMRRTVRSQKRNEGDMPEPPNRNAIPELPMEYQQTCTGERFLIYDSGIDDANRIFIFGTDHALHLLATSPDWFGDGTFKVCPQIFFQLYTLHAKIGNRVIPCIYALLPNKQEETYHNFFLKVREEIERFGGNSPVTIMFDFERAAINAAQIIFDETEVNCCFFHLSSNIWKHIQAHGLKERYVNDQDFAIHMRMLAALAFVPIDNVIESFDLLSDQIRHQYAEAEQILDYFEDTYIGRFRRNGPRRAATFPINIWNMYARTNDEIPRTNNNIEGWHRGFESTVTSAHPGFWKFLKALKKEETLSRVHILQAEGGHEPPAQRRRYVDCNARILRIVHDYENREIMHYLRAIAHNIGI